MNCNELPACDRVFRIPPGEGCTGRRVIAHGTGTACAIAKPAGIHLKALAALARQGRTASERINDLLAQEPDTHPAPIPRDRRAE